MWTKEKPKLDHECILLIRAKTMGGEWDYSGFKIIKTDSEEYFYWGIYDFDGDEWGDYEELSAQEYLIIEE